MENFTGQGERVAIEKPSGHGCFACGTANPIGLNLQFYRSGNSVCSDITLGENHQGWDNMAHGGIVSTLLDEIMAWTVIYFKRVFLVTRKMEVKYVRPVKIGKPLTVRGALADSSGHKRPKVKGEIRNREEKLLVKGSAEYVVLEEKDLSSVPEKVKEDMIALFRRF